jgi:uncharacterized membrane protein
MQDDEEALIGVLTSIIVVGFILISAVIKWIEWLSNSIGFVEVIAWSIIIIMILSAAKMAHWISKCNRKK